MPPHLDPASDLFILELSLMAAFYRWSCSDCFSEYACLSRWYVFRKKHINRRPILTISSGHSRAFRSSLFRPSCKLVCWWWIERWFLFWALFTTWIPCLLEIWLYSFNIYQDPTALSILFSCCICFLSWLVFPLMYYELWDFFHWDMNYWFNMRNVNECSLVLEKVGFFLDHSLLFTYQLLSVCSYSPCSILYIWILPWQLHSGSIISNYLPPFLVTPHTQHCGPFYPSKQSLFTQVNNIFILSPNRETSYLPRHQDHRSSHISNHTIRNSPASAVLTQHPTSKNKNVSCPTRDQHLRSPKRPRLFMLSLRQSRVQPGCSYQGSELQPILPYHFDYYNDHRFYCYYHNYHHWQWH